VEPDPPPSDSPSPAAAGAYDENGVDRSLIRWMLRLSPTERLALLQGFLELHASVTRPSDEAG